MSKTLTYSEFCETYFEKEMYAALPKDGMLFLKKDTLDGHKLFIETDMKAIAENSEIANIILECPKCGVCIDTQLSKSDEYITLYYVEKLNLFLLCPCDYTHMNYEQVRGGLDSKAIGMAFENFY